VVSASLLLHRPTLTLLASLFIIDVNAALYVEFFFFFRLAPMLSALSFSRIYPESGSLAANLVAQHIVQAVACRREPREADHGSSPRP